MIGRRRVHPALAIPAVLVAAGALVPAIVVLADTFSQGAASLEVLWSQRTLWLALRSIGLAVAVTVTCVAIAVPVAVALARTNLPGRRVLEVLLSLPIVIPSFLGAFAFLTVLGPRGLLQDLLSGIGVERLPDITGFWGAFIVLTLFSYPYVLLPATAALRNIDPATEDAARSLGRNSRQTLLRVVLPQARPAVLAGSLLVTLYVLSDFGAVSIMRFDSFTRVIFQHINSFSADAAAPLSLLLVVIALGLVAIYARFRGPLRLERSAPGAQRRPRTLSLGKYRSLGAAACWLLVLLAIGVTVFVLVWWTVTGILNGNALPEGLWTATWHSLSVSAVAGIVAVAAALPVGLLVVRHPGRLARGVEQSVWASQAIPSLVVALALAVVFITYLTPLYQTLVVLVIAYVLIYLPQALSGTQAAIGQLDPNLEDASRSLGRSWTATLFAVTIPLLSRGLVAGGILVFLNVMKELPATLLLRPIGYDTLATRVWSAAIDRFNTKAGLTGLVLLAVASVPMAIVFTRESRSGEPGIQN